MGVWARDHADLLDYWQPPIRVPVKPAEPPPLLCPLCDYTTMDPADLVLRDTTGPDT